MTPSNRDTALYRLYDVEDRLLYVGITGDPKVRFTQHRKEKPWWAEVALREVEWFSTRSDAERAEQRAIRREVPRYNDAGVQWPHHLLGQAPAAFMTMTEFRAEPIKTIDEVATTGQPLILTRKARPLVVLVPYLEPKPTE
ncbi:type II toxin-antitoxin system prevent-host-death family antitoxin [Streptomyces sp. NPDC056943]|uniref:type II toxin-antitoxin system prevent-host-death family antitoxin n=1 Tax=Streptomyces sp. NPDC056943 TaxID=3345971 RepID=UPI003631281C